MKKRLGVYVHIPFCVRKCNYCDFLSFSSSLQQQNNYTHALVKEIKMQKELSRDYIVDSIFFGGGTPSILSVENITSIMEALFRTFEMEPTAEISIECNPGTADEDLIREYTKIGFNRMSIGVQSALDSELRQLGRIHTFSQAEQCYEYARKAGFTNINMDLMSGIPGQTLESCEQSIHAITSLNPEHISAYSLIIEEGTPFYEEYKENPPINEELDRTMYALTKSLLLEKGYGRYEISNYSKAGYECKHNLKYWSGEDYIGLGLGSSSKLQNIRYKNDSDFSSYLEKMKQNSSVRHVEETLSIEDEMAEFFVLGLRKTAGVSLLEFKMKFNIDAFERYEVPLTSYLKKGFFVQDNDNIRLSDKGIDVSNYILCDFL